MGVGSAFFQPVTLGPGLGFFVCRRKVSRFHSETLSHHLACATLLDPSVSLSYLTLTASKGGRKGSPLFQKLRSDRVANGNEKVIEGGHFNPP